MNDLEKKIYREKMEAKLLSMKAEIHQLEADLVDKKADISLAIREKLQRLQHQQDSAKSKLEGLKTASGEAWEDTKTGLSKAYDVLETAFQKAKADFKQK